MYILIKTNDEKILAKQIKGAEAAVVKKNAGTVSTLDQVGVVKIAVEIRVGCEYSGVLVDLTVVAMDGCNYLIRCMCELVVMLFCSP
jgi:hypothetical protein